jgi:hypothetical protein
MGNEETIRLQPRSNKTRFVPDPRVLESIKGATQAKDYFGFDPALKPEDMTYEGKRFTNVGAEDKKNIAAVARTGWMAVPRDRHPECPTDDPSNKTIIIGGLMLMERHQEYTRIARELSENAANDQVDGQYKHLQIADVPDMPKVVKNFSRTVGQAIE